MADQRYVNLTSGNDYDAQLAAFARRQKYAELLAQQGNEDIKVESVNGIPTPISPFQGLANVLKSGMGAYLGGKAEEGAAAATAAERKAVNEERGRIFAMNPAVAATEASQGAYTGDDAEGVPSYAVNAATPGKAASYILPPDRQIDAIRALGERSSIGAEAAKLDLPLAMHNLTRDEAATDYDIKRKDQTADAKVVQDRLDREEAARVTQQNLTNERNRANDAFNQAEALRNKERADQVHKDAMQARSDASEAAVEARRIARQQRLDDQKTARENKPESQFQAASAGFADRMITAEQYLNDPEVMAAATSTYQRTAAGWWGGNYLTSTPKKSLDQAILAFTNSKLRQESGATIGDSEFEKADKEYFPQPNDPPEIIEQKRKERELVTRGMIRNAGPNYKPPTIEEKKKTNAVPKAVPANTPVDNSEAGKRARLAAANAAIAKANAAAKPPGAR